MNEIIDVHSHLIPIELTQNTNFGIEVEEEKSGNYKIDAWGFKLDVVQKNMFDPRVQLKEMAAQGLNRKVISLPPFLFAYGKDIGWAKEWTRESNEAIARVCRQYPDRFWGLGIVPLQDPGAAADEVRHCLEKLGLLGVEISTHVNGVDLDHEKFTDFFVEANRLKVSLLIHPGIISFVERLSKYYLRNLVGNPLETTICASRLLLSGFFERFPRLRVCLAHGGGAFPFILGRIRHGSSVRPEIVLPRGQFELPPGMYFDSVVHDGKALQYLVSQCGISSVVLGTDYPFDMGEGEPVGSIRRVTSGEEQAAILTGNPQRFLNLKK